MSRSLADVTRDLARAGWDEVSDQLVSGICHDLNGRVASLAGLVQLVRMDDGDVGSMTPFLDEEVSRLEGVVRSLARLPGDPTADPEPVSLAEVLPEVAALHGERREPDRMECRLDVDPETPAVLAGWVRLRRVVLIAMAEAEAVARARGRHGIAVRCRDGDGWGEVVVEAGGSGGDPDEDRRSAGREERLEALRRVAAVDGGDVSWDAAEGRLTLRLPAI